MSEGPVRSVAVLGAGIMGAPMARRIADAGLEVRVWNRSRERAEALSGEVASVAEGLIWMQASTVGIAGTERLAALAREGDVEFVD